VYAALGNLQQYNQALQEASQLEKDKEEAVMQIQTYQQEHFSS
jgi:hypothetical protein